MIKGECYDTNPMINWTAIGKRCLLKRTPIEEECIPEGT